MARIELGLQWYLTKSKNNSKTLPQLASTYLSDSFFDQITSYIEIYSTKTTSLVMYDIYRAFEYLPSEERIRIHKYLIEQLMSETNQKNLINIYYCARLCGNIHRSWLSENGLSLIQRFLDLTNQSSQESIELFLLVGNIIDEIDRSKLELYTLLDHAYE